MFNSIVGRGAFGDVYEGSLISNDGESHKASVAIKVRTYIQKYKVAYTVVRDIIAVSGCGLSEYLLRRGGTHA